MTDKVIRYTLSCFLVCIAGIGRQASPAMSRPSTRGFLALTFVRQRYSSDGRSFSFHIKIDSLDPKAESSDFSVMAEGGKVAFVFADKGGNVWRYVDADHLIQTSIDFPGTLEAFSNPTPQLILTVAKSGTNVFDFRLVGGKDNPALDVDFDRVLDAVRQATASSLEQPVNTYRVHTVHGSDIDIKVSDLLESKVHLDFMHFRIPGLADITFDNISDDKLPYARFLRIDDLAAAGILVRTVDGQASEAAANVSSSAALRSPENLKLAEKVSHVLAVK